MRRSYFPRLILAGFFLALLAGGPVLAAKARPSVQAGQRQQEKQAELKLRANDPKQALSALELLELRFGAVESSRVEWAIPNGASAYPAASLTLLIPTAKFEPALEAIHQLGLETLAEQVTVSDHTTEIADLEARAALLTADSQRLTEIEQKAQDNEELLSVQEQRKQVEGELSTAADQLNALRKKVDWAMVVIELHPVIPTFTPPPTPGPTVTQAPTPWSAQTAYQNALQTREEFMGLLVCVTGMMATLIVLLFTVISLKPK